MIALAQAYEQSRGLTHKLILTSADLILLTSGSAYSIFPNSSRALVLAASATTLPAGTLVKQAYGRVITAFASTANTITLVAILGDGNNTARYLASTTLKTVAYLAPTLLNPLLYTVADTIDLIFTAGVEAITLLTAGEVEFYFEIFDAGTLRNPNAALG